MVKVFLGGTCEGYDWRSEVIETTSHVRNLELFNPIVEVWDEEARKRENDYKEECDICVFLVTPQMAGCYSIAEAVDMSNKHPDKTVFVYIPKLVVGKNMYTFTEKMEKSIKAVGEIVVANGGKFMNSLQALTFYLETAGIIDRLKYM